MSMLPLVQEQTGITHLILAAIHLNEQPGNITLNDDSPTNEKFDPLWVEVKKMKKTGLKIMGMLGGAARGSFERLDGNDGQFEAFYGPLLKMIKKYALNGLDLDTEEKMSLEGIIRLIDRLKSDLGDDFIITLAPVATALLDRGNLSGFDYRELEAERGSKINWYNVQFYNGRSFANAPNMYTDIVCRGWSAQRVVFGVLTNPNGGSGYVAPEVVQNMLSRLSRQYRYFGGVMGWEYYNAMPDKTKPWMWAKGMAGSLTL
ncbi:uncharacterized protein N7473_013129 [Penicillium subrubescens]|uniref:uncharacterized protein n=1 Tax=Penicillium subrubescens TaxID=1316194 RepID=UPI0025450819|nr:uncharacterized protein N7473_013129 [Penicillium subrubescens]KAJ5875016.1 hypothetical protein N7473_013129 [Penicillium subrubescens]